MVSNVFFRSDALSDLSAADVANASNLGIRRIIDLRDPHEFHAAPDVAIPGAEHRSIALLEGTLAGFSLDDYPSLSEIYKRLLTTHVDRLIEAVRLVAEILPRPVLVHCTAGKDRTGMVVAIVQALVGVPLDSIVADYSVSERLLLEKPGYLDRVRRLYERAGLDARLMGPEPVESSGILLREALLGLHQDHGSVEDFVIGAGLAPRCVDRLHSALIAG